MKPLVIGIKDAQHLLGVGRTTIYNLLAEGQLQRLKIGRRTLILTTSLEDFTNNITTGAGVH